MSTILDDLTSGDAHRIWAGACAVATLRDEAELDLLCAYLPAIEKATQGIDLGGALFPNREHLNFALRKLRYYHAGAGCLCRLYPDYLMFNPTKEAAAGNIRILETDESEPWNPVYTCQCVLCGTLFRVEEGEYHTTWWKWTLVKSNDTASV